MTSAFVRLGFHVWSVPGISRAWRCELADGRTLLITDPGGFDLPDAAGPFAVLALSHRDEVLDYQILLTGLKSVSRWIHRQQRSAAGASSDSQRESESPPQRDAR